MTDKMKNILIGLFVAAAVTIMVDPPGCRAREHTGPGAATSSARTPSATTSQNSTRPSSEPATTVASAKAGAGKPSSEVSAPVA